MISTSEGCAKHLFAGLNTQPLLSDKYELILKKILFYNVIGFWESISASPSTSHSSWSSPISSSSWNRLPFATCFLLLLLTTWVLLLTGVTVQVPVHSTSIFHWVQRKRVLCKLSRNNLWLVPTLEYKNYLEPYSQNSNINHHLSETLTVSPSEHLILDSQQILRQTLTLVTYIVGCWVVRQPGGQVPVL